MKFIDLNFKTHISDTLKDLHFTYPTKAQAKMISAVLLGHNLMGESCAWQNHIFFLSIFPTFNKPLDNLELIMVPRCDLVIQKYLVVWWFQFDFIGGTDKKRQIKQLRNGKPHIVISIPYCVYDLMKSGYWKIHKAYTCVIDGVDMILDMSLVGTVDKIIRSWPKYFALNL